ncbi:YkgJ family cysteine cluster protein [archaeon]|nr:YkgJ family cysteine cluster protein [archaeon]
MNFKKQCKTCPTRKHCCIFKGDAGFTFVSLSNAKDIKKKIKKDYSFFLDYSPLSKKTINLLKEGDPALEGYLRYSLLDKKGRLLRLKTKKDGKCIFLNDDKKCEIYDIRPNICKIYPLWAMRLTDNSIKVITHDSEPECPILESRNTENIEDILSKKEINVIKKIFKLIEKETIDSRKSLKEKLSL